MGFLFTEAHKHSESSSELLVILFVPAARSLQKSRWALVLVRVLENASNIQKADLEEVGNADQE